LNIFVNADQIISPLLKEKALYFSKELKIDNFTDSDGWLDCLKKRQNINYKAIPGEPASVSIELTSNWKAVLPSLLKGYDMNDIFNPDETRIFFKALPNKTLVFKGNNCKGTKVSKERLTVLLCSSVLGEKPPPLVIGKSKRPRCFLKLKLKNLPTT